MKKTKTEIKVVYLIMEDYHGKLYLYEKERIDSFIVRLLYRIFFKEQTYEFVHSSYRMVDISDQIEKNLNEIRRKECKKTLTIDTYIVDNDGHKLIKQED